ncbi:hypothetical protein GGR54DRAFT_648426 [Hypoxylon sp. NC1633]|nr:hypothetical protein GGR54DRAFT_648426 [Hypoxylon sp. NC1633]
MAGESASVDTSSGGHSGEILVLNRKLKCDRTKPRCNRCSKTQIECVYPESRRKPAFKRRNVKELEARLAQVEVLLKEAGHNKPPRDESIETVKAVKAVEPVEPVEPINFQSAEAPSTENVIFEGLDFTEPSASFDDGATFSFQQDPSTEFSTGNLDNQVQEDTPFIGDLIDLGGMFESLPPFEMMEELNRIFFERQKHMIPIIHSPRFLHGFYSAASHMKPPLCLQYGMWALAANGHPRYGSYHEVFYRRARQYAESDEMKAYGEHFITIGHAQAWCAIATYEAKMMMFTRAAMSCARGVRLVEMMGLHRLDGDSGELSPTLLPPKDWAELEERRRTFWGIFCIDSQCSISTGWPFLIDATEITTLLPAPESAFQNGEPIKTCSIHEAFKGHPYSSFAGAVLVCHIFNMILKHVHRPTPNDNPGDYEYGKYWQRHRQIDNLLGSAFMYLPDSLRLPQNYRDPVAVHTNLNFHAAIICLHHSAIERIETCKLPESIKKICQDRLTAAAQEIVNIVKLTGNVSSQPKSPLAALSLYCAASVYVYLCKETQMPTYVENLDYILSAMEACGRTHTITRAFLRQVIVDIEQNDIKHIVRLPCLDALGPEFNTQSPHNIPLLARSKISRHTEVQGPLPGRLPLGRPVGKICDPDQCHATTWTSSQQGSTSQDTSSSAPTKSNKRKRVSPSRGTGTLDGSSAGHDSPRWASTGQSSYSTPPDPLITAAAAPPLQQQQQQFNLPHRTGSPYATATTTAMSGADADATIAAFAAQGNGNIGLDIGIMGPAPFRVLGRATGRAAPGKSVVGNWDVTGACVDAHAYAQSRRNEFGAGVEGSGDNNNNHVNGNLGGNGIGTGDGNGNRSAEEEGVPWTLMGEGLDVDWDALGASMGIDVGGAADLSGEGAAAGMGRIRWRDEF